MKIVADPNIPYVREAFAALGDITLVSGRQIAAGHVRDADVLLVRSVTAVNADLLTGSRVQFVATATIGTDHIDEALLTDRRIGFSSAAGSNANSVTEYIIAALLELADQHKFRLRDKTLGVVGIGNVGAKVVRAARALGMRVLENDPPRQQAEHLPDFVTLDRLLTEADIVTTHVPLDHSTRRLLHRDNLENFILLNSARGPVVDNRDLLKAIDGNRIPAAVLDVWENEPNISPELLDVVDLGTPHIAGYSFDGKVAGTRLIYEAACRHFQIPATWQPELPAPAVPKIELSVSSGDDEEDVLRRVISRVYAIKADDARLRAAVRDFDKQRAEYPVRREFFNTTLTLRGAADSLQEKFAALGFRLTA